MADYRNMSTEEVMSRYPKSPNGLYRKSVQVLFCLRRPHQVVGNFSIDRFNTLCQVGLNACLSDLDVLGALLNPNAAKTMI